jgi:RNA-directed DNA polymerase
MKRVGNLITRIADPDNLRLAFSSARKGKVYSDKVLRYEANLDGNLLLLREQILSGQVDVGKYHYFKIFEPKERKICAAAFDEQVLHHALMNICHDSFERVQIFDSYASRIGKGTYAALERAKVFTRRYAFYLKLDVQKFFESIHHQVVKQQIMRLFKDARLLGILAEIVDSYHTTPERGLPIGNLTSQYFANHYLAGLDHFIKEKLGIVPYVRYMDDMVLWSDDKAQLRSALDQIVEFVENELCCQLKPIQLNTCGSGLPFLGYHIFPHHVRLLQASKRRFVRKAAQAADYLVTGKWSETEYHRHIQPLLAFTQHANARNFRAYIQIGQSP